MKALFEGPANFFEKFGMNTGFIFLALGGIALYVIFEVIDFSAYASLGYVLKTLPVWGPLITFLLFFDAWMDFVKLEFDLAQDRVTLEIRLPQEVFKSPEAMELVFLQLYQTASPDNHIQTYWDGKHPPMFGLELVSRGGEVKFYMNVPRKKFKNMAETNLYAQYPGIEVIELPIDYSAEIPWDPSKFSVFSLHFNLKKADGLPIKTYYEYGLQTMPKEEEKVDPITTMLEMLGSIGPGEYYWIQFLIDAHREVTFKEGALIKQPDWKSDARKEIQKIIEGAKERAGEKAGSNIMQLLTENERDSIKAIERSLGKAPFNVRIRGMYIARNETYLPGERIGPLITAWRAYDDLNRNQIGFRWRTDFDWNIWQDPSGKRRLAYKKSELKDYKKRVYTQRNATDVARIFTTEELATVFHLPGKVALTPSLGRIPSKRSEAPPNLPVSHS